MSAELASAGIWGIFKTYIMPLLVLPVIGWFWKDRQKDSQDIKELNRKAIEYENSIDQLKHDSKTLHEKLDRSLEKVEVKMENMNQTQIQILMNVTRLTAIAEERNNK